MSSAIAQPCHADGADATNVANFTQIVTELGCADNATAKAIYDTLVAGKITGAQRTQLNTAFSTLR
jgi:hypothetical protein